MQESFQFIQTGLFILNFGNMFSCSVVVLRTNLLLEVWKVWEKAFHIFCQKSKQMRPEHLLLNRMKTVNDQTMNYEQVRTKMIRCAVTSAHSYYTTKPISVLLLTFTQYLPCTLDIISMSSFLLHTTTDIFHKMSVRNEVAKEVCVVLHLKNKHEQQCIEGQLGSLQALWREIYINTFF